MSRSHQAKQGLLRVDRFGDPRLTRAAVKFPRSIEPLARRAVFRNNLQVGDSLAPVGSANLAAASRCAAQGPRDRGRHGSKRARSVELASLEQELAETDQHGRILVSGGRFLQQFRRRRKITLFLENPRSISAA